MLNSVQFHQGPSEGGGNANDPGTGQLEWIRSPLLDDLASRIDHTVLKGEATRPQIIQLCEEAQRFGFGAVCVNPMWVPTCKAVLGEANPVAICAVNSFPLGASLMNVAIEEAVEAIKCGATQIDTVAPFGLFLSGTGQSRSGVSFHLGSLISACHQEGATVKVILECRAFDNHPDRQTLIRDLGCIALDAGADVLKTSTGTHPNGGATVEDVRLLHDLADLPGKKVKAAGGIRTLEQVFAMRGAGAHVLGMSAGVAVIQELIRLRGLAE